VIIITIVTAKIGDPNVIFNMPNDQAKIFAEVWPLTRLAMSEFANGVNKSAATCRFCQDNKQNYYKN